MPYECSWCILSTFQSFRQGQKASLCGDGRWSFQLQRLGDRHWVSVARGPVEDIVDAWQGFTATLLMPSPSLQQYQVCILAFMQVLVICLVEPQSLSK